MAAVRPADPFEFIASRLERRSRLAHSAHSASRPGWSVAAERGVSLSFLCAFYDRFVRPLERNLGRRLSTAEVVSLVVVPATGSDKCRFADLPAPEGPGPANLWDPAAQDAPLYFVSHAFGNPFALLVTSLSAHFAAAGAVPSEVFVWLDVLAINQHDTNGELRGGSTLQRTIDVSVATLVVLDREQRLPLTRLWWCATPAHNNFP